MYGILHIYLRIKFQKPQSYKVVMLFSILQLNLGIHFILNKYTIQCVYSDTFIAIFYFSRHGQSRRITKWFETIEVIFPTVLL